MMSAVATRLDHEMLERLRGIHAVMPGLQPDPVTGGDLECPGIDVTESDIDLRDLLNRRGEAARQSRRLLRAHIRAFIAITRRAEANGQTLKQAASEHADASAQALERSWVSLLTANRELETRVRSVALMFANLASSRAALTDRIHFLDVSHEELNTPAGQDFVRDYLSHFVDRPDPREARGYFWAPGWLGDADGVNALGRVVHEHRALFVSDAPPYESEVALKKAARPGRLLDSLKGEDVHHRHMILIGNPTRARGAFRGRTASEADDVRVPGSSAWFGMQLDTIVRGTPWIPVAGYLNPLAGVDDVAVDLRLEDVAGFRLYASHRINPVILRGAGSNIAVVWGAYTLGGQQVGEAVAELEVVRFAEWVMNQHGLLVELDKGAREVRRQLAHFVTLNRGAGKMFRAKSRVDVRVEGKTIVVDFDLHYRVVTEHAVIRMNKSSDETALEITD